MSFKLIWAIVPRNSGEILSKSAIDAGATGGTILMGRGTASNSFLELLGIGDSSKDIVFVLAEKNYSQIFSAMKNSFKSKFGVMFSVEVSNFLKQGKEFNQEFKMENSTHQLISVIVNKGFAEDTMNAARKAGANGGTIMNARGTAKEGDSKFFGIQIVPEKEMLWIVCETEKTTAIVEAIKNLDCLKQPGSGITFTMPASDFTILGKNAE